MDNNSSEARVPMTAPLDPGPESVSIQPGKIRRAARLLGNVAARTILPLAGAYTGLFLSLNGAHYAANLNDLRIDASTGVGPGQGALAASVMLDDSHYPHVNMGSIRFPDFIRPVPIDVTIEARPTAQAITNTITERYQYVNSVKADASQAALQAGYYFGGRGALGVGVGLTAGLVGNELAAAAFRRQRRRAGAAVPERRHPWLRGLGYNGLALATLAGGGASFAHDFHPDISHYQTTGLVGQLAAWQHAPGNDLLSPALKSLKSSKTLQAIFQDFEANHACPPTPDESLIGHGPAWPGSLTLTTYNIKSADYGIAGITDQLARTGSDVIMLQEARPAAVDALSQALNMQAITGWTINRPGLVFGNAILTRLPVESAAAYRLPSPGVEQRELLTATVQAPDGQPLMLADAHLTNDHMTLRGDTNRSIRLRQALAVTKVLRSVSGSLPVILAGDINDNVGSPAYRALTRQLRDSLHGTAVDSVPTLPSNGQRFDNILTERLPWHLTNAFRGGGHASDHCSVTAAFSLTPVSK